MKISLFGLLVTVTVASLICVLFFVLPPLWSSSVLISLTATVLPSLLFTGCLYGLGSIRAFFVGAAATAALP